MRISPSALASRLESQLDQRYLFFGSEFLLVCEASDQLRQSVRKNGVDDIIRLTAGIDLDWQQFLETSRSLGMFSTKRMIEIRLPTGKPGPEGAKALLTFLKEDHDDIIFVLLLGQIDKRTQTTMWFKEMEQKSTVVEAPTVPQRKLRGWIQERLLSKGLRADATVAEKLAFYVEGNLSAAAQEIEKLCLLLPNKEILTDELLEQCILEQATFSVYQLIDSCLQGTTDRVLRIINNLKRDGSEPILVIWALAREAREMLEMSSQVVQGQKIETVLKRHRVWSSRVRFVRQALERHSESYWQELLGRLSELDQISKGRRVEIGSIWNQLESVALSICGISIPYLPTVRNP